MLLYVPLFFSFSQTKNTRAKVKDVIPTVFGRSKVRYKGKHA